MVFTVFSAHQLISKSILHESKKALVVVRIEFCCCPNFASFFSDYVELIVLHNGLIFFCLPFLKLQNLAYIFLILRGLLPVSVNSVEVNIKDYTLLYATTTVLTRNFSL